MQTAHKSPSEPVGSNIDLLTVRQHCVILFCFSSAGLFMNNSGRTVESAESLSIHAVKCYAIFSPLEVGFFTGNWPEGDLFVLLEKDVISTQRPVRGKTRHVGKSTVLQQRNQLMLRVIS